MNKQFKLSNKNSKLSQQYLDKMNAVRQLARTYNERKGKALERKQELQGQLEELTAKVIGETDFDKVQEYSKERKSIQFDIDDLDLVINANITFLLNKERDELNKQPIAIEAKREFTTYQQSVRDEIKRIEEEANKEKKALQEELNSHPFSNVNRVEKEIDLVIQDYQRKLNAR